MLIILLSAVVVVVVVVVVLGSIPNSDKVVGMLPILRFLHPSMYLSVYCSVPGVGDRAPHCHFRQIQLERLAVVGQHSSVSDIRHPARFYDGS